MVRPELLRQRSHFYQSWLSIMKVARTYLRVSTDEQDLALSHNSKFFKALCVSWHEETDRSGGHNCTALVTYLIITKLPSKRKYRHFK